MNAIDRVREYLAPHGLAEGVMEFTVSSATVALAAVALGTEEERIAPKVRMLINFLIFIINISLSNILLHYFKF